MFASKEYLSEHLERIYRNIFDEFNSLLKNPPIVLHKIVCEDRMKDLDSSGNALENMYYINDVLIASQIDTKTFRCLIRAMPHSISRTFAETDSS